MFLIPMLGLLLNTPAFSYSYDSSLVEGFDAGSGIFGCEEFLPQIDELDPYEFKVETYGRKAFPVTDDIERQPWAKILWPRRVITFAFYDLFYWSEGERQGQVITKMFNDRMGTYLFPNGAFYEDGHLKEGKWFARLDKKTVNGESIADGLAMLMRSGGVISWIPSPSGGFRDAWRPHRFPSEAGWYLSESVFGMNSCKVIDKHRFQFASRSRYLHVDDYDNDWIYEAQTFVYGRY